MLTYLVRRSLIACMTLLLITFVVYGLIRNMPGDPTTPEISEGDTSRKVNPEDLKRLRASYGLDKPWPIAYVQWVGKLTQLDLGRSISRKKPVTTLISQRIGPTLLLSIASMLITNMLAVPMGLWFTVRAGKPDERFLSTSLYILYSFPAFVAALLLQMWLAVHLEWLPLFGMESDNYADMNAGQKVWDLFRHAFMPVVVYTYGGLAYTSRFIRANMQEVIRLDYVRTARAKGVSERKVIVKHAFRNTLIPLVTMFGLTLPGLLGGSVIIEQIFTWPGMGRLFFEAISERDYPTIMGLTLMFSILTLASQLIADFLYAFVDPRVSYS